MAFISSLYGGRTHIHQCFHRTKDCEETHPAPASPTFAAWTGLVLGGKKGGEKKKIKFSSDVIYLNKYKYKFYIKLFTNKPPSQTQTTDLRRFLSLFLLRSPSRRFAALQVFVCFSVF